MSAATYWTIGYGLDGGGYAFEPVTDGSPGDLVWDAPDTAYFPFGFPGHEHDRTELRIRTPHNAGPWPSSFAGPHGRMTLRSEGAVYETERPCDCHGRPVVPSGAAGDALPWEFTGNPSDRPHPKCQRCEGDGYVTSPGGRYAWYALAPRPSLSDWSKRLGAVKVWRCGADWIDGAVQLTRPDPERPYVGTFLVPTDEPDQWCIVRRTEDTEGEYSDETIADWLSEDDVPAAVARALA